MKKKRTLIISAMILVLILGFAAYGELSRAAEERRAENAAAAENLTAWQELFALCEKIDGAERSEDLADLTQGMVNTLTAPTPSPYALDPGRNLPFVEAGTDWPVRYYTVWPVKNFAAICQRLGDGELAGTEREEAFAIVRALNGDMLALCREVLSVIEADPARARELAKGFVPDRRTYYDEVNEKLIGFGKEYLERLARFLYDLEGMEHA